MSTITNIRYIYTRTLSTTFFYLTTLRTVYKYLCVPRLITCLVGIVTEPTLKNGKIKYWSKFVLILILIAQFPII